MPPFTPVSEPAFPPFGNVSLEAFFTTYWQKKPLLVRGAFPGFEGLIDTKTLFALARHRDVESRWVGKTPQGWVLKTGPQSAARLALDAPHPWTVLIQGLNLWVPKAEAFLRQFNFIPQTRLDDLMVSYATEGGGVGPHFDDYDVFLIQGSGRRRWQIGPQPHPRWVEEAPLKILAEFTPQEEWVLEPGDLLYLPPHWAHDGVALETGCTTYSVGFRAPRAQELGEAFLMFLQDRLALSGVYADPDLKPCAEPARLEGATLARLQALLAEVRWGPDELALFAGTYLSEPKPHVFFSPPKRPLSEKTIEKQLRQHGFALDPRTLLLFDETHFFLNGEVIDMPLALVPWVRQLANARSLTAAELGDAHTEGTGPALCQWLYECYCNGFGHLLKPETDH